MSADTFTQTEAALLPILAELQAREPIFHRHTHASTLEDFARLMAPDYWEVGASGRRYGREFILTHLSENEPMDAAAAGWQTSGFACRPLGPETYLLTYTLDQNGRLTRRSTIWQRVAGDWQILFHQGTALTSAEDDTDPGQGYTPRQTA